MTTLPQTIPVRVPRPLPATPLAGQGMGMGMGMLGAPQPPLNNALTGADVWRVIRGNIWLIIAMLVIAGVAGYGVNYWLARNHSKFTSTALLEVHGMEDRPRLDNGGGGSNPAVLEVDLHTQAELLQHERLLSSVLESSEALRGTGWFKQFVSYRGGKEFVDAQEAKQELLKGLVVTPISGSRLIRIQMSWSNPRDCQTIVKELGDQHIKEQKIRQTILNDQQTLALEQLKMNYESEIRDSTARMVRIAEDLGKMGVSMNGGASSKDYELQQLIAEQLHAQNILGTVNAKITTFEKQMETSSAPELEEALQKSFLYSEYRRQSDDAQLAYEELLNTNLGADNNRSKAMKRRMDVLAQRVSETENDIKARTAELIRANLQNDKGAAMEALGRIDTRVGAIRQEIADLAQKRNSYERLTRDVAVTRGLLDHVKDEQDKASFLYGRWAQIEWATQPDMPDHPSFPKLTVVMGVSLVIGLALSLGIAFLRELSDNSVRSPRDIARVGNMTPLGVIPHEADDPQSAGARLPLVIFEAPHSIIAEQFRQVRTRLQHSASLDTTRSILVTGCSPEDGKTTVAVNLAAGLALNGRRILIVDANFRRPNLHNVFGRANEVGFGDVL
ncbi:MAG: hypothetical protein JWN51_3535, partial [Phycisphaerales bacterium]|nr:hypothetical protein [Phycisphaerales bacterium]